MGRCEFCWLVWLCGFLLAVLPKAPIHNNNLRVWQNWAFWHRDKPVYFFVVIKSLNDGFWCKIAASLFCGGLLCRGSLAWLGRQTHNLEFARGKRLQPEVAGSNPAPGTKQKFFQL
jgi:hypothetical protein